MFQVFLRLASVQSQRQAPPRPRPCEPGCRSLRAQWRQRHEASVVKAPHAAIGLIRTMSLNHETNHKHSRKWQFMGHLLPPCWALLLDVASGAEAHRARPDAVCLWRKAPLAFSGAGWAVPSQPPMLHSSCASHRAGFFLTAEMKNR